MCMSPQLVNIKSSLIVNNLYGGVLGKDKTVSIMLPCGKCDDCRVSHSKEWALRALLELLVRPKKEQLNCWFVTLTYNNQHLPEKLDLSHVSIFIKKLRHWFEKRRMDIKIKYFVCGEYGSKNFRPHYHMLLYGCPLKDLKIYKKVGKFDYLWTSCFLDQFWKRGFIVVGNLTYKTAYYTARYTLKKYDNCDIKMSCSNGFGKKWCLDNIQKLVSSGYLRFMGRNYAIPKYFLKIIRKYWFAYFSVSEIKNWLDFPAEKNWKRGLEYCDWLKKRHRDHVKHLNDISCKLNIKEYFLYLDKLDNRLIKNKFVDLQTHEMKSGWSKTEEAIMRNKRIINQSLFSLYHNRNNFV